MYSFQILNDLHYIYFFNNNTIYSDNNYQIVSNCNLNIFITGASEKFYTIDGEIYEKWDNEDHKLSIKNPTIHVYGNLLKDDENRII